MICQKIAIVLSVCYLAAARPSTQTTIEILSKGPTSLSARFRPVGDFKSYFVSIHIKYLADAPADYTKDLESSSDLAPDGYYYVDVENALTPGKLYKIWLAAKDNYETVGMLDVFTNCDMFSHQCTASYGEICLSSQFLCDGNDDCANGEDEAKDYLGNCAITLEERPTIPPPPTPPLNAPCIVQKNAAIASGSGYLYCDQDGSYSAMYCLKEGVPPTFNCHCIDKYTGESLYQQNDFDYFTHWSFEEDCEKARSGAPK